MSCQKPFAPSADRNRAAIRDALSQELSPTDHVFEFGSGTGQHACHIAANHPEITWQPSDLPDKLIGIEQWIKESGCSNILPPIAMDLAGELPAGQIATLCYCANVLHIVSWPLVQRLFLHAAALLQTHQKLCIYGPFMFNGAYTSEGNQRFDETMRGDNDYQGLRDITKLNLLAETTGFLNATMINMPANNHLMVWTKA